MYRELNIIPPFVYSCDFRENWKLTINIIVTLFQLICDVIVHHETLRKARVEYVDIARGMDRNDGARHFPSAIKWTRLRRRNWRLECRRSRRRRWRRRRGEDTCTRRGRGQNVISRVHVAGDRTHSSATIRTYWKTWGMLMSSISLDSACLFRRYLNSRRQFSKFDRYLYAPSPLNFIHTRDKIYKVIIILFLLFLATISWIQRKRREQKYIIGRNKRDLTIYSWWKDHLL